MFALLALYVVNFSYLCLMVVCCILSWPMLIILRNRMPHPDLHKLSYHRQFWLLHTRNGQEIKYEKIQIRLDTGFFMLIALRGINRRRTVVVFYDQITKSECRMLHIIEKIDKQTALNI